MEEVEDAYYRRRSEFMNNSQNDNACQRLNAYLVMQWIAVVVATLFLHASSTFFWTVNLITFLALFIGYIRFSALNDFIIALCFSLSGVFSFAINLRFLGTSIKAVGTNVGIIVIPIYILLFSFLNNNKPLHNIDLYRLMKCLSILGTITMAAAFILSGKNMIGVLRGSLNSYNVSLSGFFYSKNIYGAFVALSLMADFYLLKSGFRNRGGYSICIIKVIAVILSSSRAALLLTGVSLLTLFLLSKHRTLKEWAVLLLISLVIVVVLFRHPDYIAIFENNVLKLDIGDAGRNVARTRAFASIPNSIITRLFGVGYAGIDYFKIDIDNSFYNEYFSGGIIKIILVVVMLIYSFFKCANLRKENIVLGNSCIAAVLSYLAYALFESTPVFELGIINYCFMFFMYIIPWGYSFNE